MSTVPVPPDPSKAAGVAPVDARADLEAELREEFEFHIKLLRAREMEAGTGASVARQAALRRFGDPDRYVRRCRDIVLGGTTMQRRVLLAWNIVLTLALTFTTLVAWRAYERAVGPILTPAGGGPTALSLRDRGAILHSIWGEDAGMIEIRGNVRNPGHFHSSLDAPLSIAALVELAGGVGENAKLAAVTRPDIGGEWVVSLKNAMKRPQETQLMPEPGSVVDVR